MNGEKKIASNDALVMVFVRNQFYKRKYYYSLAIAVLGLLIIGVLTGALLYLLKHPRLPLYFVTDGAGRFIQEIPVQVPNMAVADVASWAQEAVEAAYSYDYANYREQLQHAQRYFTDYGWRSYMKGLQQSNNLLALTQRKLVVIAKVVASPKLDVQGPLGAQAIYAYKFEMPVLVTYLRPPYDDASKFENALIITVIVQRQSILSSYKGLGIVQMIATTAQGTETTLAPPT